MPSTSIRITEDSLDVLRQLADQEARPVQAVLHAAIELYRRQKFLEDANTAFALLRQKPEAWQEELEERALWDGTLADGQVPA